MSDLVRVAPLQFLLAFVAGLLGREQQRVIDYLLAENRILRDALGKRRLRLTNEKRAKLAVLGKALGRKLLEKFAPIVTPETILAWHRKLVAMKWTYPAKSPGRPPVAKKIARLIVRFARQNATWGVKRIQGALANVGHRVARSTIAAVLKRNGLSPAPERKTTWSTFLKAHAAGLAGADFLAVEVWTLRGLRTFFILFAIRLATRKVEVLGVTDRIDDDFRRQAARNLVDDECEAMKGVSHLIIDRDSNYSEAFSGVLKSADVKVVRTPPRSPNCNPHAERFVLTLRRELLDRMIFGSPTPLVGVRRPPGPALARAADAPPRTLELRRATPSQPRRPRRRSSARRLAPFATDAEGDGAARARGGSMMKAVPKSSVCADIRIRLPFGKRARNSPHPHPQNVSEGPTRAA